MVFDARQAIAKLKTPCFIVENSLRGAVSLFSDAENPYLALLHCVTSYPTPPEDVNLLKFRTLSQAFPMITLGFSDHTQGPMASSIALGMGAKVFENHC